MRSTRFAIALLFLISCLAAAAAPNPATRPAPKPHILPAGIRGEFDVQYVPGGDGFQRLDIYFPEKPSAKRSPLLVFIHGGGWMAGSKSDCPFIPEVRRGYIVASVDYRFFQTAIFPAQIQDCQAAIRWLRANSGKYNIDPDRIGAGGQSAGGHLVALLGTSGGKNAFKPIGGNEIVSDRVQAVCDEFGPSDFNTVAIQAKEDKNVKSGMDFSTSGIYSKLVGGARLGKDREICDAVSPVHYVTKDNPPFLILHGDRDPVVPFAQSQELADKLARAGVEATLHRLAGAGHGTADFNQPAISRLIENFFDKHLKGADVKIEPSPEESPTTKPSGAK